MEYLIALDLEGVHGVVGEPLEVSPYAIGVGTGQYEVAKASAVAEVNRVVKALFAGDATRVLVWDNHGARDNIDFSLVDSRAEKLVVDKTKPRLAFLSDYHFQGIVFIGYHSKAGAVNGNLAHTYNGMEIQYVKLNGKQVGEFDIDSYIAGEYGVAPIFAASDDVCVGQVREHSPSTVTVITKIGKGKRKAELFDESAVLQEIEKGVGEAMKKKIPPTKLSFPCEFEIRYSKMEMAEWKMEILSQQFEGLHYGEDGNTLCLTLDSIDALRGVFF